MLWLYRSLTARDLLAAVSAVSLGLLATPVSAQDPPVASDQADVIDEIIVTATKRELSVQDVPLNISVFDEQRLHEADLYDIRRLANEVPGLNMIDYGAEHYGDLIMRGMNATRLQMYDTSGTTSVYFNDTLLDYTHFDVNDVARIEVLRGPQGTLYGGGAVGGTIRFVSNPPDPDEFQGWIETGWSSFDSSGDFGSNTSALVNVPIIDGDLALRVSASYRDLPGYVTKFGYPDRPGLPDVVREDQNSSERMNTRAALRWILNDAVEMTLTYSGQRFDTDGNSETSPGVGDALTGVGGIIDEYTREEIKLYSLDVIGDLGFAELTSNSAYFEERRSRLEDMTRYMLELSEAQELDFELFPEFFETTEGLHRTERLTQEFRLVSSRPDRFVDYVAGVFYLDEKDTGGENVMHTPGLADFLNSLYLGPGATSSRPDDHHLVAYQVTEERELAFFGEVTFNLADHWDITLGGRKFDYEITGFTDFAFPIFEELLHNFGEPGCVPTQGGTDPTLFGCSYTRTIMDAELSDSVYKLGTSYNLDSVDALLFATIAEGYRPGGANYVDPITVDVIDRRLLGYDPDTATSYEVGVKSTLLDSRLRLNASLYHIDWEDIQLATGLGGGGAILNGDDATIDGIEIDLTALISDSLRMDLSLTRLRAELTEDTVSVPDIDGQKGDRLPGSAEFQANVALRYETVIDNNIRWWARLSGSYSGDVNAYLNDNQVNRLMDPPVPSENRFFEQMPGYTVWNLGMGFERDRWSALLRVDNLFDERYVVATSTFEQGPVEDPLSRNHYYGRPRSYGFSLRYDF